MRRRYLLPLVFSLILVSGILIGNWYGNRFYNTGKKINTFFTNDRNAGERELSFSLIPRTNKISSILSYIDNEYVDSVDIGEITESAIPEIISQLDPHSVYIPAEDLQRFNEPLMGNFSGIGIEFNMNEDTVAVVNTIPNGPSETVGVMAGDRIILVDDSLIAGVKMPTRDVIGLLKGPKGSTVRVSILRKGEKDLLDFEIIRDDIPLYSVDVAYMMQDDIGYLKISNFAQTTYREFLEGITKLHDQGMKRLILDLRRNGGGVMDAATNIADQFLDENKLIVYTQGKARPRYDVYSTAKGVCKEDELIILIDEYSASASEILAGAIQDNDRGTIIGRRSFGKGLVQEQIEFRDGSALRLTIARYYTPTGRSIQKPYENGREDYYHDLEERFMNGELINPDSIKFADSLKFITPGGKVVYGGGGIMPDIFIPVDTSDMTDYFRKSRNLGLMYRFAFDYTDRKREQLSQYSSISDLEKYLEKSGYFEEFVKFAQSKGLEPNRQEIGISRELIATEIKAYIARNILNNEGFYPIAHRTDYTLQKALDIISIK